MDTDGRYVITAIDAPLAANAINRQEPISLTLWQYEAALGERPDLIVIAVPPGTCDAVSAELRPLLDGDAPPARLAVGEIDTDG